MREEDLTVVRGFIRSGQVRFHPALAPLMVPIDSVQPAPYNYNNGDVEEIMRSIETSGMYGPIKSQDATGYVVMGNHTWLACKELGAEMIPVVPLEVNETEAKRMMVADNRTAQLAKPDYGLLAALLHDIQDDVGTLIGTAFTEDDLKVIEHLNEIPLDTEEDHFAQWPTFSVQVHPNVLRGFRHMTSEADTDAQAFELLLRLAGWNGER